MSPPLPAPTPERTNRIRYLDGLRGYSILMVVVLHTLGHTPIPQWLLPLDMLFGNGTLGVDIFFVISGFLITTLLLKESDRTGSISLADFYKRRIARIFPALYIYVAVIALLNLSGVLHIEWRRFLPAGLLCWNYGALLNMPTDDSTRHVFGHFWSLSLEEQFYLFWPSCLVLMSRKTARLMVWVIIATIPFIRFGSYVLFPSSRPQLGAMFHTSVDLILWGALVAFAFRDGVHLRWAKRVWLGWATLAYGIVTIFVQSYVGGYLPGSGRFLVPTLYTSFAALLLIWLLSGSGGIVRGILEWRPLRWLGVFSYSLYIWQQIFVEPGSSMRAPFPLNIAFAVTAACISYYFVESPLRNKLRQVLIRPSARNNKAAFQQT